MESVNLIAQIAGIHPIWILLLIVWTFAWKGFALWHSARLHQKYWFVALLVINTLGILEIIYLFFVSRKYRVEVVEEK